VGSLLAITNSFFIKSDTLNLLLKNQNIIWDLHRLINQSVTQVALLFEIILCSFKLLVSIKVKGSNPSANFFNKKLILFVPLILV